MPINAVRPQLLSAHTAEATDRHHPPFIIRQSERESERASAHGHTHTHTDVWTGDGLWYPNNILRTLLTRNGRPVVVKADYRQTLALQPP